MRRRAKRNGALLMGRENNENTEQTEKTEKTENFMNFGLFLFIPLFLSFSYSP
jgi:hypothetical protein